ncbi:MAG: RNA 2',3'-cyclic phosphodiesterase [Patescibacteria group bacterium]|jgi:2'-5' RNA ligase
MIQPETTKESMKYRAFLAIYPSSEVIKLLGRVLADLKNSPLPVKWVEKQNLHLTLKFFGAQADDRIYDIEQVLENVLSGFDPFTLRLNGISLFPEDKPKIISADLDVSPELTKLKRAIDSEVSQLPFVQGDRRSFLTHITLGRISSSLSDDHKKILNKVVLNDSWDVSAVHLMESDLTGNSPNYSVLQSYQL